MATKKNSFFEECRLEFFDPRRTPFRLISGFFISQNISLLLTFSLPRVKKEKIIKIQKPIAAAKKWVLLRKGVP